MTRYEVWPVLVIAPLYVYWRSRRLGAASLVAVGLAAFPCTWLVGNFRALGDPLPGFGHQAKGALMQGAQAYSTVDAAALLGSIAAEELGWPVALLALAGVIVCALGRADEGRREVRTLYLGATTIFWGAMLWMATVRGESFFARFLLLGLVLVLPCAIVPLRASGRVWLAGALVGATIASPARYVSERYVTRREPTAIRELATWLASSPYRDAPVLLTELGWDASYLALYWPEVSGRRSIVSAWMDDHYLASFVRLRRPALLVTRPNDGTQRSRIEQTLGASIATAAKVRTFGEVEVYDIRALVERAPS